MTLRGIKSVPFREENILCYVTGSDLHWSTKAGLSICVPFVFSLPGTDHIVSALRALSFFQDK